MALMACINRWELTVPGDELGTVLGEGGLWVTESATKEEPRTVSRGKSQNTKGHFGSKNVMLRGLDREVETKERCGKGRNGKPSKQSKGSVWLLELELP